MSRVYCDRCGQNDQSITIDAIRAMDASTQFSQSVGMIRDSDGDTTPFMTTHVQRADLNLLTLKTRASEFASGTAFMKTKLQNFTLASRMQDPELRRGMVELLIGSVLVILFFVTIAIDMRQIFLGMAFALGGLVFYVLSVIHNNRVSQRVGQAARDRLTPEERDYIKRCALGSYCRRCDKFSPDHPGE